MLNQYAFSLIAGSSLGTSHTHIDNFLPNAAFGSAEIKTSLNLTTGNLVCCDHQLRFVDQGENIDLSYIYNSLVKKPWRLNVTPIITNIEDNKQIVVIEADGAEVTYQYDAEKKLYAAAQYQNGQPVLSFDEDKNEWVRTHPSTRDKEIFNIKGQLNKKINALGNETQFVVTEHNELTKIIGASSDEYEIKRETKQLISVLKNKILLHQYKLDDSERLVQSITADGYTIDYSYDEHGLLKNIRQSDLTELSFSIYSPTKCCDFY